MFTDIFLPELMGTATLLLFGCGVVANATLPKTNGKGGGFLMINFGWGIGVFAGVFVAVKSGAHINPAVTAGLVATGDITLTEAGVYVVAQVAGGFLGACLCFLAYKRHFDEDEGLPEEKLGVFSTMPGIRAPGWNLATEIIATFVLVFVIIAFAGTPDKLGPLAVALLVVGIGASLGGPTGYAINPARDLGPRLAHAVLPITHKGPNGWWYAWVPVVGPLVGGTLAGLAGGALSGTLAYG